MKKTCRNCHFLAKEGLGGRHCFAWTESEREQGRIDNSSFSVLCREKQWDEGIGPRIDLDVLLNEDRRTCLFFEPFSPKMPFKGARNRRDKRLSARKGNLATCLAIASLAIAIFALLNQWLF